MTKPVNTQTVGNYTFTCYPEGKYDDDDEVWRLVVRLTPEHAAIQRNQTYNPELHLCYKNSTFVQLALVDQNVPDETEIMAMGLQPDSLRYLAQMLFLKAAEIEERYERGELDIS